jgi:hypothetical protein
MKKNDLKIKFRIPKSIYDQILKDLRRKHEYAYERVGFIHSTSTELASSNTHIITVTEYFPVKDVNYIKDTSVGARINSSAIREEMQRVLDKNTGCFHVHLHDHPGETTPSFTDRKEIPGIIRSFSNVNDKPLGIIIFSSNSIYVSVKVNNFKHFVTPEMIAVVGYPMKFIIPGKKRRSNSSVFDRQSFLGNMSQHLFNHVKVGIIGFGGGGSHFGQQLAHIGIKNQVIYEDDFVEDTNMNRLVGGWFTDIKRKTPKIKVAERLIKKILPNSRLKLIGEKWQNAPQYLQECDIILGAVDTYAGRRDLETECRRYLIPFIDIGMDIHPVENSAPLMAGQVILSMPGMPCMHCYGYLTEDKLAREAAKYGATGGRPQVIWPNGILASTAIGTCIDLITGWTNLKDRLVYLSMNGNTQTIVNHIRIEHCPSGCTHFPFSQTGPPKFTKL